MVVCWRDDDGCMLLKGWCGDVKVTKRPVRAGRCGGGRVKPPEPLQCPLQTTPHRDHCVVQLSADSHNRSMQTFLVIHFKRHTRLLWQFTHKVYHHYRYKYYCYNYHFYYYYFQI